MMNCATPSALDVAMTLLDRAGLAEAISKLPTFGASKLNAPGNAPKLVASSLAVAFGVHSEGEVKSDETLENTGDSPLLSPVACCPFRDKREIGCGARI